MQRAKSSPVDTQLQVLDRFPAVNNYIQESHTHKLNSSSSFNMDLQLQATPMREETRLVTNTRNCETEYPKSEYSIPQDHNYTRPPSHETACIPNIPNAYPVFPFSSQKNDTHGSYVPSQTSQNSLPSLKSSESKGRNPPSTANMAGKSSTSPTNGESTDNDWPSTNCHRSSKGRLLRVFSSKKSSHPLITSTIKEQRINKSSAFSTKLYTHYINTRHIHIFPSHTTSTSGEVTPKISSVLPSNPTPMEIPNRIIWSSKNNDGCNSIQAGSSKSQSFGSYKIPKLRERTLTIQHPVLKPTKFDETTRLERARKQSKTHEMESTLNYETPPQTHLFENPSIESIDKNQIIVRQLQILDNVTSTVPMKHTQIDKAVMNSKVADCFSNNEYGQDELQFFVPNHPQQEQEQQLYTKPGPLCSKNRVKHPRDQPRQRRNRKPRIPTGRPPGRPRKNKNPSLIQNEKEKRANIMENNLQFKKHIKNEFPTFNKRKRSAKRGENARKSSLRSNTFQAVSGNTRIHGEIGKATLLPNGKSISEQFQDVKLGCKSMVPIPNLDPAYVRQLVSSTSSNSSAHSGERPLQKRPLKPRFKNHSLSSSNESLPSFFCLSPTPEKQIKLPDEPSKKKRMRKRKQKTEESTQSTSKIETLEEQDLLKANRQHKRQKLSRRCRYDWKERDREYIPSYSLRRQDVEKMNYCLRNHGQITPSNDNILLPVVRTRKKRSDAGTKRRFPQNIFSNKKRVVSKSESEITFTNQSPKSLIFGNLSYHFRIARSLNKTYHRKRRREREALKKISDEIQSSNVTRDSDGTLEKEPDYPKDFQNESESLSSLTKTVTEEVPEVVEKPEFSRELVVSIIKQDPAVPPFGITIDDICKANRRGKGGEDDILIVAMQAAGVNLNDGYESDSTVLLNPDDRDYDDLQLELNYMVPDQLEQTIIDIDDQNAFVTKKDAKWAAKALVTDMRIIIPPTLDIESELGRSEKPFGIKSNPPFLAPQFFMNAAFSNSSPLQSLSDSDSLMDFQDHGHESSCGYNDNDNNLLTEENLLSNPPTPTDISEHSNQSSFYECKVEKQLEEMLLEENSLNENIVSPFSQDEDASSLACEISEAPELNQTEDLTQLDPQIDQVLTQDAEKMLKQDTTEQKIHSISDENVKDLNGIVGPIPLTNYDNKTKESQQCSAKQEIFRKDDTTSNELLIIITNVNSDKNSLETEEKIDNEMLDISAVSAQPETLINSGQSIDENTDLKVVDTTISKQQFTTISDNENKIRSTDLLAASKPKYRVSLGLIPQLNIHRIRPAQVKIPMEMENPMRNITSKGNRPGHAVIIASTKVAETAAFDETQDNVSKDCNSPVNAVSSKKLEKIMPEQQITCNDSSMETITIKKKQASVSPLYSKKNEAFSPKNFPQSIFPKKSYSTTKLKTEPLSSNSSKRVKSPVHVDLTNDDSENSSDSIIFVAHFSKAKVAKESKGISMHDSLKMEPLPEVSGYLNVTSPSFASDISSAKEAQEDVFPKNAVDEIKLVHESQKMPEELLNDINALPDSTLLLHTARDITETHIKNDEIDASFVEIDKNVDCSATNQDINNVILETDIVPKIPEKIPENVPNSKLDDQDMEVYLETEEEEENVRIWVPDELLANLSKDIDNDMAPEEQNMSEKDITEAEEAEVLYDKINAFQQYKNTHETIQHNIPLENSCNQREIKIKEPIENSPERESDDFVGSIAGTDTLEIPTTIQNATNVVKEICDEIEIIKRKESPENSREGENEILAEEKLKLEKTKMLMNAEDNTHEKDDAIISQNATQVNCFGEFCNQTEPQIKTEESHRNSPEIESEKSVEDEKEHGKIEDCVMETKHHIHAEELCDRTGIMIQTKKSLENSLERESEKYFEKEKAEICVEGVAEGYTDEIYTIVSQDVTQSNVVEEFCNQSKSELKMTEVIENSHNGESQELIVCGNNSVCDEQEKPEGEGKVEDIEEIIIPQNAQEHNFIEEFCDHTRTEMKRVESLDNSSERESEKVIEGNGEEQTECEETMEVISQNPQEQNVSDAQRICNQTEPETKMTEVIENLPKRESQKFVEEEQEKTEICIEGAAEGYTNKIHTFVSQNVTKISVIVEEFCDPTRAEISLENLPDRENEKVIDIVQEALGLSFVGGISEECTDKMDTLISQNANEQNFVEEFFNQNAPEINLTEVIENSAEGESQKILEDIQQKMNTIDLAEITISQNATKHSIVATEEFCCQTGIQNKESLESTHKGENEKLTEDELEKTEISMQHISDEIFEKRNDSQKKGILEIQKELEENGETMNEGMQNSIQLNFEKEKSEMMLGDYNMVSSSENINVHNSLTNNLMQIEPFSPENIGAMVEVTTEKITGEEEIDQENNSNDDGDYESVERDSDGCDLQIDETLNVSCTITSLNILSVGATETSTDSFSNILKSSVEHEKLTFYVSNDDAVEDTHLVNPIQTDQSLGYKKRKYNRKSRALEEVVKTISKTKNRMRSQEESKIRREITNKVSKDLKTLVKRGRSKNPKSVNLQVDETMTNSEFQMTDTEKEKQNCRISVISEGPCHIPIAAEYSSENVNNSVRTSSHSAQSNQELGGLKDYYQKLTTCHICKYTFVYPHEASKCLLGHGIKKCWICLQNVKAFKDALRIHTAKVHSQAYRIIQETKKEYVQCDICDKWSPLSVEYRKHIESSHLGISGKNSRISAIVKNTSFNSTNSAYSSSVTSTEENSGRSPHPLNMHLQKLIIRENENAEHISSNAEKTSEQSYNAAALDHLISRVQRQANISSGALNSGLPRIAGLITSPISSPEPEGVTMPSASNMTPNRILCQETPLNGSSVNTKYIHRFKIPNQPNATGTTMEIPQTNVSNQPRLPIVNYSNQIEQERNLEVQRLFQNMENDFRKQIGGIRIPENISITRNTQSVLSRIIHPSEITQPGCSATNPQQQRQIIDIRRSSQSVNPHDSQQQNHHLRQSSSTAQENLQANLSIIHKATMTKASLSHRQLPPPIPAPHSNMLQNNLLRQGGSQYARPTPVSNHVSNPVSNHPVSNHGAGGNQAFCYPQSHQLLPPSTITSPTNNNQVPVQVRSRRQSDQIPPYFTQEHNMGNVPYSAHTLSVFTQPQRRVEHTNNISSGFHNERQAVIRNISMQNSNQNGFQNLNNGVSTSMVPTVLYRPHHRSCSSPWCRETNYPQASFTSPSTSSLTIQSNSTAGNNSTQNHRQIVNSNRRDETIQIHPPQLPQHYLSGTPSQNAPVISSRTTTASSSSSNSAFHNVQPPAHQGVIHYPTTIHYLGVIVKMLNGEIVVDNSHHLIYAHCQQTAGNYVTPQRIFQHLEDNQSEMGDVMRFCSNLNHIFRNWLYRLDSTDKDWVLNSLHPANKLYVLGLFNSIFESVVQNMDPMTEACVETMNSWLRIGKLCLAAELSQLNSTIHP